MQFRQLRYVLEVHKCGNHISAAAAVLNTSQPGISKQIQLLESELGFAIFQRERNRVIGLTEPGREVIEIAQRILGDAESLRKIREDYVDEQSGRLAVATTQTFARYILPSVIDRFLQQYPGVRLSLNERNPTEICEAVESSEADIGVGTEPLRLFPTLLSLPSISIKRSLVARAGHRILAVEKLTLEEIAKYPIIAHDRYRNGQWKVLDAFRQRGIEPNILFDGVDADVSKSYVERGLGIAVLASVAVDLKHDPELRARDASHLFQSSTSYIWLRSNSYLRRFIFDFISLCDPALKPKNVRQALSAQAAFALGVKAASG